MEKQASSNQREKVTEFQGKYNNITIFLAKFLFQQNFSMLKKSGFINAFVSDPEIESLTENEESVIGGGRNLYLLFKSKKMSVENLAKIVESLSVEKVKLLHKYELINNYSMVVLQFPKDYKEDYDLVLSGSYSNLSDEFKSKFEMVQEVTNTSGKVLGKEYTLYHHIFNKTEWLQQFWKDRLGMFELEPTLELWEQPSDKDLKFNVKDIIQ